VILSIIECYRFRAKATLAQELQKAQHDTPKLLSKLLATLPFVVLPLSFTLAACPATVRADWLNVGFQRRRKMNAPPESNNQK